MVTVSGGGSESPSYLLLDGERQVVEHGGLLDQPVQEAGGHGLTHSHTDINIKRRPDRLLLLPLWGPSLPSSCICGAP